MTTTDLVPALYPFALNGTAFLVDDSDDAPHRHVSVPVIKQQQDTSENVGEQTINPAGLWRRSFESWHKGAGQTYFDRPTSDPARFRRSRGVDVWTENVVSLLPETSSVYSFTAQRVPISAPDRPASRPRLAESYSDSLAISSYLYLWDGEHIKYSDDEGANWANVSGEPTVDRCRGFVKFGSVVLAHCGVEGLYQIGGSSMAKCVSTALSDYNGFVGVANGRLFVGKEGVLYNVTSIDTATPPALPTALLTITGGFWVGCADGPNHVYLGADVAGGSRVYKTTIQPDGTDLAVPTVALLLPSDEQITSITSSLNQFVVLGLSNGVRVCTIDESGNLLAAARLPLGRIVGLMPRGRFVYAWGESPDGVGAGIWRIDLSTFNGTAPAYASDLFASGLVATNYVTDLVEHRGVLWFLEVPYNSGSYTGSSALYKEQTTKEATGYVDSGWIEYGLSEEKIALKLRVRHDPMPASNASLVASMATDGGASYTTIGTSSTASAVSSEFTIDAVRASRFELRTTLNDTATSGGPVLDALTHFVLPTSEPGNIVQVPILLNAIDRVDSRDITRDPSTDLAAIKTLRTSRTPVEAQIASTTVDVIVEDYEFNASERTPDGRAWQGTCLLTLKVL